MSALECTWPECDGVLFQVDDDYLPAYMERRECGSCAEWYLIDTRDGEIQIDS